MSVSPSKVSFASPSKVFAVPEPVITLLSALLFIVVDVILLKVDPSPTNDVAVKAPDDELNVRFVPVCGVTVSYTHLRAHET